jgi:DNA repair photolyase
MDITEITVKTALIRSKIPGVSFVLNPYLGCGHGCRYCYAAFMTKYSRHHAGQPWGSFVEIKTNIVELLQKELSRRKQPGVVLLSSVCDPYQPVERRYRLTRQCLEILNQCGWGIDILTRSPLVTRDLDLLADMANISVGFSIPTDDDAVRRILEPHAPPIPARVAALRVLHEAGLKTWAFLGPMLPMDPARLHELVAPYVDHVLIDRLNYRRQVRSLFLQHHWDDELTDEYAQTTQAQLLRLFGRKAAPV